jgi:hypothetical protein
MDDTTNTLGGTYIRRSVPPLPIRLDMAAIVPCENRLNIRIPESRYTGKSYSCLPNLSRLEKTTTMTAMVRSGLSMTQTKPSIDRLYLTLRSRATRLVTR